MPKEPKRETRTFKHHKDTEHTRVYKETPPAGTPPIVGQIYLQSWFAGEAKEITVTVELQ